jgi:hypothetical protein
MNIFTAAITGLTIVIKKIGIAFKAVLTGLKIVIITVADFIVSVITAIINAIVSVIKWMWTQIVNVIHWLFRTYLRLEAGCVPPVQKLVGLMIKLRWGFVIVSALYAVYKYFGITYLLISIAFCVGLVTVGYSQAAEEEEKWNSTIDKINEIILGYLKYLIRLLVMAFSVYSLHIVFKNAILTIFSSAVSVFIIFYSVSWRKKRANQPTGFIRNKDVHSSSKKQDKLNALTIKFLSAVFWLVWFVLFIIGLVSYYKQL